jgi:hypothetical protein
MSASNLLVQQVLAIHDLTYVSEEHHGDYVSEVKMGIKQNHTPS